MSKELIYQQHYSRGLYIHNSWEKWNETQAWGQKIEQEQSCEKKNSNISSNTCIRPFRDMEITSLVFVGFFVEKKKNQFN